MEEDDAAINRLRSALSERFLCEYVNILETVVLFPDDPELAERIYNVVLEFNRPVLGRRKK